MPCAGQGRSKHTYISLSSVANPTPRHVPTYLDSLSHPSIHPPIHPSFHPFRKTRDTIRQTEIQTETAKRRCGRPKRKEHYRRPGLLRGHPCILTVLFHLHFAAPCCTCLDLLHLALAPALAHSAPCTLHPAPCPLHLHPATCNPTQPFESRPHVPPVNCLPRYLRSWHASLHMPTYPSTFVHTPIHPYLQYSTVRAERPLGLDMGMGMAMDRRAWPSPPLTVEGQSRSPLPCPSSVSAMAISMSDPD